MIIELSWSYILIIIKNNLPRDKGSLLYSHAFRLDIYFGSN